MWPRFESGHSHITFYSGDCLKDWNKVYKERGIIQSEVFPLVKKAAGIFKEKNVSKILDLGCGTGRHIVFLTTEGFDVYGVDISESGLEITKKRLEEIGAESKLKINDMASLDFEDNFFDAVISTFVINHAKIEKFRKIISEVKRILKKDGLFVFTVLSDKDGWFGKGEEIEKNTFLPTMNPEEADVPHHYFSEKELKDELKDFKILEFKHVLFWSERRKVNCANFEVICQK